MKLVAFSPRQMQALCWWCERSPWRDKTAVICDGAVRSGKTLCLGISFVCWAFYRFNGMSFAICGKTIRSVRRNLVTEMLPVLRELGFGCEYRMAENLLLVTCGGRSNRFYLFGGRDESSQSLIQGMTLAGVLLDEVVLMPRSFVEQALARCSVEGARFWFSCNPESPGHWFYGEWICKVEEKNALYLHFTMDDNPSLSPATRARYKKLFSGVFYERFVEGRWTRPQGLVYPFMEDKLIDKVPGGLGRWVVSCDYGTVNPSSFGLWGERDGVWYRVAEYYFDARREGVRRTDGEHLAALQTLLNGRQPQAVIVDPSAASFITLLRQAGYTVLPAHNDVLDGIRRTAQALQSGEVQICKTCRDAVREFGLYRWDDRADRDAPVKEHDHAMDDIRYFVTTWLPVQSGESGDAVAVTRSASIWEGDALWNF